LYRVHTGDLGRWHAGDGMHHPSRPPRRTPEDLVAAVAGAGVRDQRVLAAFGRVRRELFVPEELAGAAYHDRPVPIAHRQVTTQPSLVAQMVAALQLRGGERVLEVGTGLGFQAAVLGVLAGDGRVVTVERFADLAEQAAANLAAAGIANVTVVVGDGTLGWPETAPYDAVVVAAAAPRVPVPLAAQLVEGGRLVQPLGPGGAELVTLFGKRRGRLVRRGVVVGAHFVRLVGAHGLPGR
jgi:protein-L-isoaspartate(D-aspartate) O-methyltransferase